MFTAIVLCLIFLAGVRLSVSDELDLNHNVECKPVPNVVPVEQDGLPYFVTLYRCQGSVQYLSPSKRKCVNKTTNSVPVKVNELDGPKRIIMYNHTSCQGVCVFDEACKKDLFERDEKLCTCGKCKLDKAPNGCPANFRWNVQLCKCKCALRESDAPKLKTVDKNQCKFVCATRRDCKRIGSEFSFNEDSCKCKRTIQRVEKREGDDNKSQGKLIAALMIGEFVLLYLIFDFLLYSKKTGLIYYIKCKCSSKIQKEPTQDETESKKFVDNANEPNGTPVSVRVDRNGTSTVTKSQELHVSSL